MKCLIRGVIFCLNYASSRRDPYVRFFRYQSMFPVLVYQVFLPFHFRKFLIGKTGGKLLRKGIVASANELENERIAHKVNAGKGGKFPTRSPSKVATKDVGDGGKEDKGSRVIMDQGRPRKVGLIDRDLVERASYGLKRNWMDTAEYGKFR